MTVHENVGQRGKTLRDEAHGYVLIHAHDGEDEREVGESRKDSSIHRGEQTGKWNVRLASVLVTDAESEFARVSEAASVCLFQKCPHVLIASQYDGATNDLVSGECIRFSFVLHHDQHIALLHVQLL